MDDQGTEPRCPICGQKRRHIDGETISEEEREWIRSNWLSTTAAGKRLHGASGEQVRKLIERRKLRALDVNEGGKVRSWMVDPHSVEEYRRRNIVEPETEQPETEPETGTETGTEPEPQAEPDAAAEDEQPPS